MFIIKIDHNKHYQKLISNNISIKKKYKGYKSLFQSYRGGEFFNDEITTIIFIQLNEDNKTEIIGELTTYVLSDTNLYDDSFSVIDSVIDNILSLPRKTLPDNNKFEIVIAIIDSLKSLKNYNDICFYLKQIICKYEDQTKLIKYILNTMLNKFNSANIASIIYNIFSGISNEKYIKLYIKIIYNFLGNGEKAFFIKSLNSVLYDLVMTNKITEEKLFIMKYYGVNVFKEDNYNYIEKWGGIDKKMLILSRYIINYRNFIYNKTLILF